MIRTAATWLAEHSGDHDMATAFVTHMFGQLGRHLSEEDDPSPP